MKQVFDSVIEYAFSMGVLEFFGMLFGLLAVYYLIKQNNLTWITGILYVLVSFIVFWDAKLYADFGLHVVFLILNIYGWYHWTHPGEKVSELKVTRAPFWVLGTTVIGSLVGVLILGYLLGKTDASLAYWDSTTTVLSIFAMWLTARKYLENWHIWLVVDVLATGIYVYKEIYFYALLYGVYIIMAIIGLRKWQKSMGVYSHA